MQQNKLVKLVEFCFIALHSSDFRKVRELVGENKYAFGFKSDETAIIKQFNSTIDLEQLDNEAYKYRKANEKSGTTVNSYNSFWRTIDVTLLNRLKQVYLSDLMMFDYPHDPM